MRVCLFEDSAALDLEPLTLTRPVFDLLCGCTSLAEKQFRAFLASFSPTQEAGSGDRAALVRAELAEVVREQSPGLVVNDVGWLSEGPAVMVNGRWLPPPPAPGGPDGPCVALIDDEVAFAVVPADLLRASAGAPVEEQVAQWVAHLPHRPAGGVLLRHLWDVVDHNAEQIALDYWLAAPERPRREGGLPALVGPADRLAVDPSAHLDPLVMADTTRGPVVIGAGAVVTAFTRLEGPCYVGPRTHVHGAKVRAGTTLGPDCRVGGEVEASIVQGCSNKAHDGFLGHAYVGEWVNLGAGTHNSDLRNDYGEVRVAANGRLVRTGKTKVGCYLGDHTKAGLGTLLNTGTNVGAFCHLLPAGGLLPRHAPSFTGVREGVWVENADLEALLHTAGVVMARRQRALSDAQRALYAHVLEQTAAMRRQAIRAAEARRLRAA
jgi:UDP-N-acetylglucosamine diphosphorylase/glucosamine-1-phosphate N-acetyltransferase